jgi:hypothetical protein
MAAAYTNKLSRFINSICSSLSINIRTGDVELVEKILRDCTDREVLKMLREETTLLVLMVRVRNEKRKEKWEEHVAEMEEIQQDDGPLFEGGEKNGS